MKKVEDQLKINDMAFKIKEVDYQAAIKSLVRYSNKIFVPDFVIKARIEDVDKNPSLPQVFSLNS
jgi:hypothetical protein